VAPACGGSCANATAPRGPSGFGRAFTRAANSPDNGRGPLYERTGHGLRFSARFAGIEYAPRLASGEKRGVVITVCIHFCIGVERDEWV
jgi:hypothetical protein